MKLADLLTNQKIIIQITWGEQKIEFFSDVVDREGTVVYVTPYIHDKGELQLNITEGTGVVCNVFADDTFNGQRISWRNVELTTVTRNNRILYCIRTHGFNNVAQSDERRNNERTVVGLDGRVVDLNYDEEFDVIIHDISGVGISYYASETYAPKSQQVTVIFSDTIDKKTFNLKVECVICRTSVEEGHTTVGCKFASENRDFQLYRLIKHLKSKNATKTNVLDSEKLRTESEEENGEIDTNITDTSMDTTTTDTITDSITETATEITTEAE